MNLIPALFAGLFIAMALIPATFKLLEVLTGGYE
jgi:hypothetical protein